MWHNVYEIEKPSPRRFLGVAWEDRGWAILGSMSSRVGSHRVRCPYRVRFKTPSGQKWAETHVYLGDLPQSFLSSPSS